MQRYNKDSNFFQLQLKKRLLHSFACVITTGNQTLRVPQTSFTSISKWYSHPIHTLKSLCRIRSNNSILSHTNRKILASKHIFSCILKQIISFDSIITICVSIIISYDSPFTTYDLVIDAVPKHFISANDAVFKRVFGRFFKSFSIFLFLIYNLMLTFAKTTLAGSPTRGKARVGYIYIKGVTVRFGFDVLELRNFKWLVKNKATGTPCGVHIHSALNISYNRMLWEDVRVCWYIHHRGAFGVARFD